MEDINNLTIIGNMVKDAELKYTNSGTAITKLTIAVNRSVKKGDNWEDEASFFEVSLWGKRVESLNQYLLKGTKIAVNGSLKQETWEQDGNKRSKVIIMADNIQLLGGKKDNSNGGQSNQSQNVNNNYNSSQSYNQKPVNNGNFEDDIPF